MAGKGYFPPQRTDWKFNFKRGSHVQVQTRAEGCIEGYVAQNPVEMGTPKFLELRQAFQITGTPTNQQRKSLGFMRIDASDVYQVREIVKPKGKLPANAQTEKLYCTVIIDTEAKLLHLLKEMAPYNEVGLNLYGVYMGRDGEVGWVTLFIGDTVVCIDALELYKLMGETFWETLRKPLFENDRICKVMYDSRLIHDYLFHKHCICLSNYDDLQVSEVEAWAVGQPVETVRKKVAGGDYKPLSEMIGTFVADVPREEVKLLQDFEDEDFSVTFPLMMRPFQDQDKKYCKCIAIEMKYLLTLKKTFENMILRRKNMIVICQAEELMNAGNDRIVMHKKYPLRIPENVIRRFLNPVGQLVEFRQMKGMNRWAGSSKGSGTK